MKRTLKYYCILAGFYHLFVVGGIFSYFGIFISPLTHRPISLALALGLLFLMPFSEKTAGRAAKTAAALLLVTGLVPLLFLVCFPDQVTDYSLYGTLDTKGAIFAFALFVVLVEASRRSSDSIVMPLILIAVFLATVFGNYMPGILHSSGFSLRQLGLVLYVSPNGFFGVPLGVATTIVVMFLIFSQLLKSVGASDWFIRIALSMVGSQKGGPAKAAVVASAFFGSISGSPSSNAAGTGVITIPLMKQTGYTPEFAGAVEATASTGGQILPPIMGSVAFIMAEWLEVSYIDIAKAALVPALLYFATLLYGVDIEARKKGLQGMARPDTASLFTILKEGWFHLLPLAIIVYFLVIIQYPPEISALYAIVSTCVLAVFVDKDRRRLSVPSFPVLVRRLQALVLAIGDGFRLWVKMGAICAAVGILIGCLTQSGVGLKTASFIIRAAQGHFFLVLVYSALAAYVLGMGMNTLPLYLTLAILVAPALEELGLAPIVAHLYVLFWGLTSFLTPPVCLAVYITATIAKSDIWKTAFHSMRLGVVLFIIPFAFAYFPALLFQGTGVEFLTALARTALATLGILSGLNGYFGKKLHRALRFVLFSGGVFALTQNTALTVCGVSIIVAFLLYRISAGRIFKAGAAPVK